MIGTLIMASIPFVFTAIFQRFNLWTIGALISTAMFCGRKIGYFCKFSHLVAIEILVMIPTILLQILFKNFILWKFLMTVICRIVFIGVVLYDKLVYVYIQEVRRKQ